MSERSEYTKFEYSSDGYLKARAYLQEIGQFDHVSSSGLSTDGYSVIHAANAIWRQRHANADAAQ